MKLNIILFIPSLIFSACTSSSPDISDTRYTYPSEDSMKKTGIRFYINSDGYITSGIKPKKTVYRYEMTDNEDGSFSSILYGEPESSEERYDPLENMPEFEEAFSAANSFAFKKAIPYKGKLGCIHVFWNEKKQFLRENYKIDWKTPAELNTNTIYD